MTRLDAIETAHKILVLDDEPDMIDMILRMVRGHYHAVGATRAADALAWLEEQRFDCILVDQRLRDGTGTSVLARCATLSPLCRRIAMSGQAEMGDLLAAINVAKVSRFILKPFSRDLLLATLADSLAEYEAERAELEHMLVERSARAGERQLVAPRRSSRRRRGRPTFWPSGPGVRQLSTADMAPLLSLFDPDLQLVVASLRPERAGDADAAAEWCAEVELRLITRLRDTDQAFRLDDGRFLVAFARTSKDGCRRACRRLAEKLRGGIRVDLVGWPDDAPALPEELVANLLAR